MDRGRAGGFVTDNNFSMKQIKEKQFKEHLHRLEKIKVRRAGSSITLDNNPPVIVKAALSNPRKAALRNEFNVVVAKENKSLLKRISMILTAPPAISTKDYYDMKKLCGSGTVDAKDAFENKLREEKIKRFFANIKHVKPMYNARQWEDEYKKQKFNQKFMSQVKYRRPKDFVDPFATEETAEGASPSPHERKTHGLNSGASNQNEAFPMVTTEGKADEVDVEVGSQQEESPRDQEASVKKSKSASHVDRIRAVKSQKNAPGPIRSKSSRPHPHNSSPALSSSSSSSNAKKAHNIPRTKAEDGGHSQSQSQSGRSGNNNPSDTVVPAVAEKEEEEEEDVGYEQDFEDNNNNNNNSSSSKREQQGQEDLYEIDDFEATDTEKPKRGNGGNGGGEEYEYDDGFEPVSEAEQRAISVVVFTGDDEYSHDGFYGENDDDQATALPTNTTTKTSNNKAQKGKKQSVVAAEEVATEDEDAGFVVVRKVVDQQEDVEESRPAAGVASEVDTDIEQQPKQQLSNKNKKDASAAKQQQQQQQPGSGQEDTYRHNKNNQKSPSPHNNNNNSKAVAPKPHSSSKPTASKKPSKAAPPSSSSSSSNRPPSKPTTTTAVTTDESQAPEDPSHRDQSTKSQATPQGDNHSLSSAGSQSHSQSSSKKSHRKPHSHSDSQHSSNNNSNKKRSKDDRHHNHNHHNHHHHHHHHHHHAEQNLTEEEEGAYEPQQEHRIMIVSLARPVKLMREVIAPHHSLAIAVHPYNNNSQEPNNNNNNAVSSGGMIHKAREGFDLQVSYMDATLECFLVNQETLLITVRGLNTEVPFDAEAVISEHDLTMICDLPPEETDQDDAALETGVKPARAILHDIDALTSIATEIVENIELRMDFGTETRIILNLIHEIDPEEGVQASSLYMNPAKPMASPAHAMGSSGGQQQQQQLYPHSPMGQHQHHQHHPAIAHVIPRTQSFGASAVPFNVVQDEDVEEILLAGSGDVLVLTGGLRVPVHFNTSNMNILNINKLIEYAKQQQRVEHVYVLYRAFVINEEQLKVVTTVVSGTVKTFKRAGTSTTSGSVQLAVAPPQVLVFTMPLPPVVQLDSELVLDFAANVVQNLKIEHDTKSGINSLLMQTPS